MATREEQKAFNQAVRDLTTVAKRGDLPGMRALLASEPGLVSSDIPVLRTCEAGQPQALALLLEAGAAAEALPSKDGDQSRRPLIKALATERGGRWPEGRRRCAEHLVEAGASLGFLPSWNSVSARVGAAAQGNRAALVWLDELAPGPLDLFEAAALAEEDRVAELLREAPDRARARSAGGGTALHNCAHSALGVDDARTARALARIAERLIDAGAPLGATTGPEAGRERSISPYDALYLATDVGNHAVALVLAERGLAPERILLQALDHQAGPLLDWLAPRAAELDLDAIRDARRGNPFLGEMVRWGRFESARWLIAHGADPRKADGEGWTPLHFAARRGAGEPLLTALLEAGADPLARDADGRTPIDLARERGKDAARAFLERWSCA